MNKNSATKASLWLSLSLAFVGVALMEARIRSQQSDLTTPVIMMSIGAMGVLVSEMARRRATPKVHSAEDRKAREEWLERGVLVDYDIAFLVFASGIVVEFFSFNQFEYRIMAAVAYFLLSYFVYFKKRKSISTFQWDFIFHFALVFALPITAVAWQRPEFWSEIGISQIETSREISMLTFIYVQAGLLLSTVMAASRGWRSNYLKKRELSVKALQILQGDFLSRVQDEERRDRLREIVSDIAILRESFIYGQFQVTVAWGWSITDRLLSQLSSQRAIKRRAEELCLLTSEFNKCYETRNKTVHRGYRPNFDDAFGCLQLLKMIMLKLGNQ